MEERAGWPEVKDDLRYAAMLDEVLTKDCITSLKKGILCLTETRHTFVLMEITIFTIIG